MFKFFSKSPKVPSPPSPAPSPSPSTQSPPPHSRSTNPPSTAPTPPQDPSGEQLRGLGLNVPVGDATEEVQGGRGGGGPAPAMGGGGGEGQNGGGPLRRGSFRRNSTAPPAPDRNGSTSRVGGSVERTTSPLSFSGSSAAGGGFASPYGSAMGFSSSDGGRDPSQIYGAFSRFFFFFPSFLVRNGRGEWD